ncbi:MAG: RNA polymerase sigma-70 factor (ECF subfamily) [Alphaproteobacteria bacterium]
MALIEACSLGDNFALETSYKKFAPLLHRYAFNILRNEALSNEVLQDSFIQIWKQSHSYRVEQGKPLTWLRTIVRNKAIDMLRAEKKASPSLSI